MTLKDWKKTFWDVIPFNSSEVREWLQRFAVTVSVVFLVLGAVHAFTGDANAQSNTFNVVVESNETLIQERDEVRISTYAMSGDGESTEDESPPPSLAFLVVEPDNTISCWNFIEENWVTLGSNNEISAGCIETFEDTFPHSYGLTVTIPNLEDLDNLENDIATFTGIVFGYEVQSNLVVENTVGSGSITFTNLNLSQSAEESNQFLTAGAFQFDGWDESNTVFLLTLLILLTFSAYHGLVGCVFACVLAIPIPIWNELSSSDFPFGFAAFALLYTVMLCLHVAYEGMGGTRATSERGGMF